MRTILEGGACFTYKISVRSVMPGSIPEHLNLVSVDTLGHKLSPVELKLMVQYCPHLKSVNFKYLPDDQQIKAVAKISFQGNSLSYFILGKMLTAPRLE